MFDDAMRIDDFDPELWQAMEAERHRQEDRIELIASENYASPRRSAQGSPVLTNKYAEGYPGKRYYGGCEHVDVAEALAIARAKELFGAAYAIQPSGSQRMPLSTCPREPQRYHSGYDLAHGGHLTRRVRQLLGKVYKAVQYGLNTDTGEIDYDEVAALRRTQPKLLIAGFSVLRVIDWQRFRDIADSVGAYLIVDMAHVAGQRPTLSKSGRHCQRYNINDSQTLRPAAESSGARRKVLAP